VSFSDNGVEFKVYVNEEIIRLKEQVTSLHENEVFKEDADLINKLNGIKEVLGKFQTKKISPQMIEKIMQVQKLIKECSD
jgi:CHAD domain-containing protein